MDNYVPLTSRGAGVHALSIALDNGLYELLNGDNMSKWQIRAVSFVVHITSSAAIRHFTQAAARASLQNHFVPGQYDLINEGTPIRVT